MPEELRQKAQDKMQRVFRDTQHQMIKERTPTGHFRKGRFTEKAYRHIEQEIKEEKQRTLFRDTEVEVKPEEVHKELEKIAPEEEVLDTMPKDKKQRVQALFLAADIKEADDFDVDSIISGTAPERHAIGMLLSRELSPTHKEALGILGKWQKIESRTDQAREDWRKWVRHHTGDVSIAISPGMVRHYRDGELAEVRAVGPDRSISLFYNPAAYGKVPVKKGKITTFEPGVEIHGKTYRKKEVEGLDVHRISGKTVFTEKHQRPVEIDGAPHIIPKETTGAQERLYKAMVKTGARTTEEIAKATGKTKAQIEKGFKGLEKVGLLSTEKALRSEDFWGGSPRRKAESLLGDTKKKKGTTLGGGLLGAGE